MTPEAYYRRALWIPVLLPLVGAGIVWLMIGASPRPPASIRAVADAAQFLVLAGIVSIVPYGIFVWLTVRRNPTMTEAELRRLSWLAPSYIAGPFAVVMGLVAVPSSGARSALTFGWYVGLVALGTGYFYAVLINATLGALRLAGRVDGSTDPSGVLRGR